MKPMFIIYFKAFIGLGQSGIYLQYFNLFKIRIIFKTSSK